MLCNILNISICSKSLFFKKSVVLALTTLVIYFDL
jgi:hypothetical protein